MIEVTCDKCGHVFEASPANIKESAYKHNMTVTNLVCPNCNNLYLVCYDNNITKQLKKEWSAENYKLNSEVQKKLIREIKKLHDYMDLMKKLGRD